MIPYPPPRRFARLPATPWPFGPLRLGARRGSGLAPDSLRAMLGTPGRRMSRDGR